MLHRPYGRTEDFSANSIGSSGVRCFICNGPHLARDCPDHRHPGPARGYYPKGKSKGKSSFVNVMDDYYMNGKGKGKNKGKKGMYLDAQAQCYKGKGNSKMPYQRPVNAYATDLYLGGLEMSNSMELAAATSPTARPELGMIDCGAKASAAPDAVVKGLISSILECYRGARIDIDQSARPYFRFGSGRWGRALYRIHISSDVSGVSRKFSLFALPNPSEFYEVNFDKSTLVPVLVGMDFLGKHVPHAC